MNSSKFSSALVVAALVGQAHASPLRLGYFNTFKSDSRMMIAAPHGGFDLNTDLLALRLVRRLGWSCVAATGFRKKSRPINVNRPTEGVGLKSSQERHTEDARIVYDAFMKHIEEVSPNGIDFYVEIHGMNRPEIYDHIQIATVGISTDDAEKIKRLFGREIAKLGLNYQVTIEGIDDIHFTAMGAKTFGSLKDVSRALHIELPWGLRVQQMTEGVELLAAVLPKVAKLLTCDGRLESVL